MPFYFKKKYVQCLKRSLCNGIWIYNLRNPAIKYYIYIYTQFFFFTFSHLNVTLFFQLLILQKRQTECIVCSFRIFFCVCVCVKLSVLCWLCETWTKYQVTLVIVECADENNETLLTDTQWNHRAFSGGGWHCLEDIASDQVGRWTRRQKRSKYEKRVRGTVTDVFPCQPNKNVLI